MSQIEELHALKERVQAIKARLHLLNKQIGEIQDRARTSYLKAVVDLERCVACGICADQCPANAITHGEQILYNGYYSWKLDLQACQTFCFENKE